MPSLVLAATHNSSTADMDRVGLFGIPCVLLVSMLPLPSFLLLQELLSAVATFLLGLRELWPSGVDLVLDHLVVVLVVGELLRGGRPRVRSNVLDDRVVSLSVCTRLVIARNHAAVRMQDSLIHKVVFLVSSQGSLVCLTPKARVASVRSEHLLAPSCPLCLSVVLMLAAGCLLAFPSVWVHLESILLAHRESLVLKRVCADAA